jgi:5-methylthioribose kinase
MRAAWQRAFPLGIYIDGVDLDATTRLLASVGRPAALSVSRAGEGNMNLVLRAATWDGPVVVKQARPWVERFSAIPAPAARFQVEAHFYRRISGTLAERWFPTLLAVAPESGALVFKDLGPTSDMTAIYQGWSPSRDTTRSLGAALAAIHVTDAGELVNEDMRALNHAYIFEEPLTAGKVFDGPCAAVHAAAHAALQRHRDPIRRLGDRYLHDRGPALLHGDYHAGSWLIDESGVRVIDPEFGFTGPAAFDVGVAIAHLTMARLDDAIPAFLEGYSLAVDAGLARAFAGVEIVRRLTGVARTPVLPAPALHEALLSRALSWLDAA